MQIKIIDFGLEHTRLPYRAYDNDAGADVFAPYDIEIAPQEVIKIPLGFGVEIPDGLAGFVFPRSSLSAKGIVCELPPIDSGYRGEIHAVISNVSNKSYSIKKYDRIGQLVILPVVIPNLVLKMNERGSGAFGSTGK